MVLTDDVPGHIIETVDVTIGALHDTLPPVLIIPAMIPHTIDHPHTGAHQLTLRTTADHIPTQHTNQVRQPCINLHHILAELQAICKWTSTAQIITLVIPKMIRTI